MATVGPERSRKAHALRYTSPHFLPMGRPAVSSTTTEKFLGDGIRPYAKSEGLIHLKPHAPLPWLV
jgi:hypothetical protein